MKIKNKFLIILFLLILFFLDSKENLKNIDLYLQKILLIPLEKKYSFSIDSLVYDEINLALEFLERDNFLILERNSNWLKYKNLITNKKNIEKLKDFYLLTDIWGLIYFNVIENDTQWLVKVNLLNIILNRNIEKEFIFQKDNIIDNLNKFRDFLLTSIKDEFYPVNLKDIYDMKYENRIKDKKNIFSDILLSLGVGFTLKDSNESRQPIYSYGVKPYFNFNSRFDKFNLSIHFDYNALFNDKIITYENNNQYIYDFTYLHTIFTSLDLGGWFIYNTYLFGIGFAFSYFNNYQYAKEVIDYYKTLYYYKINDNYQVFIYFRFSFLPIRLFQITIDSGTFLTFPIKSLILTYFYMPIYVNFNLKYFIYKGIFLELTIPFYMIAYQAETELKSSIKFMIDIGIGYRFEWRKK